MNTIKTISNISYNSLDYLERVITSLCERGVIDWAYWIPHKADVDELKDHAHIVLKPAKRIDTQALKHEFDELDPNNVKPLSVTSKWNPCNSMEDWLLYAVHDKRYLASKGQVRNIEYAFEDIRATDLDALRADWNSIDRRKFDRLQMVEEAVRNDVPFYVLLQQGVVPIQQIMQYQQLYYQLGEAMMRADGGRKRSHERSADPVSADEDGVILEPVNPDTEGELKAEQATLFDGFVSADDVQF